MARAEPTLPTPATAKSLRAAGWQSTGKARTAYSGRWASPVTALVPARQIVRTLTEVFGLERPSLLVACAERPTSSEPAVRPDGRSRSLDRKKTSREGEEHAGNAPLTEAQKEVANMTAKEYADWIAQQYVNSLNRGDEEE